MSEKHNVSLLPSSVQTEIQEMPPRRPRKLLALRFLICLAYCSYALFRYAPHLGFFNDDADLCSQAAVLVPEENRAIWASFGRAIGTDAFKHKAIDWLAGAVKVPTESYDTMDPVGTDPRWETFALFHDYLLKAFPLVHVTLKLTKVNTYGLLYTWQGSDASLKPILLAAHQDVVPVDPTTVHNWVHPPYSGHFDGKRLWGRGSSDDKSGLIGVLSTIESLLERKFQPSRTVVLSFGFDEEAGGLEGAGNLSKALLDIYGEEGFAFVVDEGAGFVEEYGSVVATPGIAEKGHLDVRVEVTAPGGHSSVPPDHTSIGILSSLLAEYEANPFKVQLSREEPLYSTLQCVAEHAKDLPPTLRRTIKRSAHSKRALRSLEKLVFKNPIYKSLAGTTQAIDLIQGGVKANALPERAWAVVNHRIAVTSSAHETKSRDTRLLQSLASKFNLTYHAFGTRISEEGAPSSGSLTLSDAFQTALEPAPVTPSGKSAAPYQLLSGSIKATYKSHRSSQDVDTIIVAPGMMTGNTDTRFYWKLSQHIFRYNHHNAGNSSNVLAGIHTVNESIDVDAFLEMIRFFTTLILNADESTAL